MSVYGLPIAAEDALAVALTEYNCMGDPAFWRPMATELIDGMLKAGIIIVEPRPTHYEWRQSSSPPRADGG